jgi:fido (protein-threonine AMPylation protein)
MNVNTFNPSFKRVDTFEECADMINLPHEDYPRRVYLTQDMLNFYNDHLFISEVMCKAIHSYIMHDMQPRHRGAWRKEDAFLQKSNGDIIALTAPIMIAGEIEESQLFPWWFEDIVDETDIVRWYRTFQIIHPFMDGNGRTGGVIAAVASYQFFKDGTMLAPCQ